MTITGTVVNGAVVPDAGTQLPEGARMNMTFVSEGELDNWPDLTDEMEPYSRESVVASLRESIAEMKAGYPGRPLEEVMAEIAAKYNLPSVNPDPS